MQEDYLIMCECFCKGFVNFMLNNKSVTHFTWLISSNDFRQNDKKYCNFFVKSDNL